MGAEQSGERFVRFLDGSVLVGHDVRIRRELEQRVVPPPLCLELALRIDDGVVLSAELFLGDAQLLDCGEELRVGGRVGVRLVERLGVEPEAIAVLSSEPTEWPNACLGLKQPATLCAQVITPGYKVLLEHNGTQYEYRTDLTGSAIAADCCQLQSP